MPLKPRSSPSAAWRCRPSSTTCCSSSTSSRRRGARNRKSCTSAPRTGDAEVGRLRFYAGFSQFDCKPSHLPLFARTPRDLESLVLEQDAIFVGGGNTRSMLAVWRDWGLDRHLRRAWERGVVLGGGSAGSICWFEHGVTDSIAGPADRAAVPRLSRRQQLPALRQRAAAPADVSQAGREREHSRRRRSRRRRRAALRRRQARARRVEPAARQGLSRHALGQARGRAALPTRYLGRR